MSRAFNRVRAASILVEATLRRDREVASQYGVGVRTIESWRSRLRWDEDLVYEYESLLVGKLADWLSDIPQALKNSIDFINRAALHGDPHDPKMVEAMNGAIATLAEVLVLNEEIQKRKALMNGSGGDFNLSPTSNTGQAKTN